jgi:hypothetical protein
MQITSIERFPHGASGRAVSRRGRRYIFFTSLDGDAAVFREHAQGGAFVQIKPNTARALRLAVRKAVRS